MHGRLILGLLLSLVSVARQQEAAAAIPGLVVAWPAAATANEALTNYLVSSEEVARISGGRQIVSEAFHLSVRVPDQRCQAKRGKQANATLADPCIAWITAPADVTAIAGAGPEDLRAAMVFLPPYRKSVRRDEEDEDDETSNLVGGVQGMEIGPRVVLDAGAAAMVQRDAASAERLLKCACLLLPKNGDAASAERLLKRACLLLPKSAAPRTRLAMRLLKRACLLLPKSAAPRTRLAMVYAAGGREEEMMAALRDACEVSP
ncbi:hypothetical protein T484DRAFT_1815348 [Baffinella frigidus]|nr:hypothetical protein T484DRAFT_1815348 [Cryptophyta sp. CCMP2293]